ncbi:MULTISPECIES: DUF58 domain-containing protein [unclassified Lentimonas]|uniref:DUF58 domain-containing protein n=1 Tax=unclassified Lentimonas TaxID=2630993 RepID=UPI0013222B2D|nr:MULTISPECIES: DUF58 domain-containing protein [unclassified Lentimonas]CAA6690616.1 Unannotated [Lentimonas sp. CC10]CAA6695243.1 Unannotated [Lentimonas sp. CC19]CAA7068872.1 Unannotated [Lentimonas sp. CC11]
MAHTNTELSHWHDWTDPDFFATARQQEHRFLPLFLRQILPGHLLQTRLTLTGWCLIIVSLGLGLAAYNTASNILFLSLSLLLSSLILSGILSWMNFRKLQWELQAPAHLKVGEVGMAEVDLANAKALFPSMAICFRVDTEMAEASERLYMHQALSAGESCKLEWTFVPQRRGRYQLRLSGVQSQFPFGFLQKTIGSDSETSVLVWPARIDYSFLASPGGQRISAGASRKNSGLGNDLLNIRPYERGDAPRLVHWKATARMRRLMIRQLAQEGESGYHLQLDPDASRWTPQQFEVLCSLACSLAEDLFHLGRLESVLIGDSGAMPVRNIHELHDFFDQLACLERQPQAELPKAFVRSNRLTFRPCGESGVAIYVEANQAGQTHS